MQLPSYPGLNMPPLSPFDVCHIVWGEACPGNEEEFIFTALHPEYLWSPRTQEVETTAGLEWHPTPERRVDQIEVIPGQRDQLWIGEIPLPGLLSIQPPLLHTATSTGHRGSESQHLRSLTASISQENALTLVGPLQADEHIWVYQSDCIVPEGLPPTCRDKTTGIDDDMIDPQGMRPIDHTFRADEHRQQMRARRCRAH